MWEDKGWLSQEEITENSGSVSWKMHKFRLFSSKQLKLAYVSEREIDREKRSGNPVPKFSWVSSRTRKKSLLV